ncbi:MAG: cytochrome c [Caldilineaceae bacterium]|nr:cytochrome c [Caldilineaceae bacterium]
MNSLARFSRVPLVLTFALVALLFLIVGCAPDADAALLAPDLGPKLVLAQSEGAVEIAPTPVPPKLAELTDEEIYAGLDADVQQAIVNADPSQGETIALTFGCVGCHSLDPNEVKTGPTWHNVGDTAIVRVPGESPAQYIYQSITDPNSFVVPGYPSNVMPQNFSSTMSPAQIADMVAFLLQQNGQ